MAQSANMNVMIATARKAGRALAKDFREIENLQVSVKGAGDFVSRADIYADQIVKEELTAARPTYGFLAAEHEELQGKDPTRRWIVDSLVGTTNFLHGMPHYAVSIALEHKNEIVAGVIYDAAQDECFFAEALDISGPPGYARPKCLATLSKTSPAESSNVLPKIL